jgi:hypothetical protein
MMTELREENTEIKIKKMAKRKKSKLRRRKNKMIRSEFFKMSLLSVNSEVDITALNKLRDLLAPFLFVH